MKKNRLQNLMALLFGIFVSFCFIELTSRLLNLDSAATWLGRSTVGFTELPIDIHQASANSNLIYELRPNTQVNLGYVHPLETQYKKFLVKINGLGFRGDEFSPKKKEGQFRVFFMGSSNTFGMVAENDTYPVQTQKILDKKKPGRYELINGGVSGYVISQISAATEEVIKKFESDIVFLQYSNVGRRPFYYKDENYAEHFKKNPELFRENLPNIWPDSTTLTKLHYDLIDTFASYRVITGVLIYIRYILPCALKFDQHEAFINCTNQTPLRRAYETYSENVSKRDNEVLIKNNKHIRFVLFHPQHTDCKLMTDHKYPNLLHYSFCNRPLNSEYGDIHPPSYVYTWYAKQLADLIIKIDSEEQHRN